MTVEVNWSNLPAEMRNRAQWVIAGPDKVPFYVDGSTGNVFPASPISGPWMSFEMACYYASYFKINIGFVLTQEDGLCCIDMDVKDASSVDSKGKRLLPHKWTPQSELDRYSQAVYTFGSYTELSASGKGLHVWVRGDIGQGVRKDGFEVYSQERFIICTGAALTAVNYHIDDQSIAHATIADSTVQPVQQRDNILEPFVQWLRDQRTDTEGVLVELEPTEPDNVIYDRAVNAENGTKFVELWRGEWQQAGYPSQSEADLSLMSMLTFYSESNEQCRRLFRMSALGQREKAVKNNTYLDRTLRIIRGRQEREKRTEVSIDLAAMQTAQELRQQASTPTAPPQSTSPTTLDAVAELNAKHIQETVRAVAEVAAEPLPEVEGLPWPPGMIGALSAFIYNASPRPVKEVSIVAALGLIAGIAGRAYNIPQSGLNLYVILVARSGIGKEAMHSGPSLILKKIREANMPWIDTFVDFTDYASGPALVKACAENKSFVNVAGEWGRKLRRFGMEDGRDGPMAQLRTTMLNLYQKSSHESMVGGIGYSNKDQNVASVNGVAYSMIGETTPGTLYESLTKSMMEDGFLSRFTIIEYNGKRPPLNENRLTQMDDRLFKALTGLAIQAMQLNNGAPALVEYSEPARQMLDAFNLECDKNIDDAGDDEATRQMWNRAHLKVLRIAALCAVADNYAIPVVQVEHAQWALEVVRRDIAIMSRKLEDGDVGLGDDSRERKIVALCKEYLKGKVAKGYNIPEDMINDGVVPRKFFQSRTASIASFSQHRLGSSAALDLTLRSLCDSGYLAEMERNKSTEKYGFHGRSFRITSLPKYTE